LQVLFCASLKNHQHRDFPTGHISERPIINLLLQADEPQYSLEENASGKHCNGGIETGVLNKVVEIEDGLYTRVERVIEDKGSAALETNLISTAEDDFHLSVESCRSSGLLLTGKKRSNFQQVIIGSKKIKETCSRNFMF